MSHFQTVTELCIASRFLFFCECYEGARSVNVCLCMGVVRTKLVTSKPPIGNQNIDIVLCIIQVKSLGNVIFPYKKKTENKEQTKKTVQKSFI